MRDLPSDWTTSIIADCLAPSVGGSSRKIQKRNYLPIGRYPVVDQGQQLIAGWTEDEAALIDQDLPVIVFGDHTRALKYVDFRFARGADGTQILKPKSHIHPRFFYYACQNIDLESRGYNRHFSALKECLIPLPPESEQASIAFILGRVETLLDVETRLRETLRQLKQATIEHLFTHGLRGEAQKETEIGLVPDSWSVIDFSSVRKWLQYGTSVRCSGEPATFPVLRIPNIEPGRVNAADLKYCDMSAAEADNYRLTNGDLIFIRTNGVLDRLGSCAVYAGEPERALFASYLIRARLYLDKVVPRFAACFFGSERGTSVVAGRATPAADGKYNLNTGTIDSFPLPLPPTLDEQREIVAILDAIDRKTDLHTRKRDLLDELFRSLLLKLMTGEVRMSDLNLDHSNLATSGDSDWNPIQHESPALAGP